MDFFTTIDPFAEYEKKKTTAGRLCVNLFSFLVFCIFAVVYAAYAAAQFQNTPPAAAYGTTTLNGQSVGLIMRSEISCPASSTSFSVSPPDWPTQCNPVIQAVTATTSLVTLDLCQTRVLDGRSNYFVICWDTSCPAPQTNLTIKNENFGVFGPPTGYASGITVTIDSVTDVNGQTTWSAGVQPVGVQNTASAFFCSSTAVQIFLPNSVTTTTYSKQSQLAFAGSVLGFISTLFAVIRYLSKWVFHTLARCCGCAPKDKADSAGGSEKRAQQSSSQSDRPPVELVAQPAGAEDGTSQ